MTSSDRSIQIRLSLVATVPYENGFRFGDVTDPTNDNVFFLIADDNGNIPHYFSPVEPGIATGRLGVLISRDLKHGIICKTEIKLLYRLDGRMLPNRYWVRTGKIALPAVIEEGYKQFGLDTSFKVLV